MRFVTFRNPKGTPEAGVAAHDHIVSLSGAGFGSMLDVLAGGSAALQKVKEWMVAPPQSAVHPLVGVKLLAPIPRPPKVICVGLNYRDHAEESNMTIPDRPTIFNKFPHTVIGPGEPIVLPKNSGQPDYEAEFALVIGKSGRHIAPENWQQHVFGYTNLNDVSARDFQLATTQWLMGKTFDTFCPMGPYLVTADEVADPHNLNIKITINGEVLQNSNTKHLIFNIPALITYLSSVFTLEVGDVISTGTPAGVGFARKPPRWLLAGDKVVVEVEGLGELQNPVIAEA
ncbi:MAG TPA: fumarylacetoacetate hydrolase family protein [Bryobacteraceae bacterium]|nr:fumarylacetoacetate hydrolase family protein [Bryobacteraceae bacterium]